MCRCHFQARLTVGQREIIGNDGDSASLEVVSVDLVSQTRDRAEVLEVTVESIGEVEFTVTGADDQVVQGVELSAKVVVQEDCC